MSATTVKPQPAVQDNIPALDGLRALACIAVLCAHGFPRILGYDPSSEVRLFMGAFGVMLFFVLSGFLLSLRYFPLAHRQLGFLYWVSFLIRRFFRIYPLYAVLCLLTWWISPFWTTDFKESALYKRLLLIDGKNYWWTIPVEVRFYIIFPLVVSFCMLAGRKNNTLRLLLGVIAWGFLCFLSRGYQFSIHFSPPWTFHNFFIGLPVFFIGGVLLGYSYKLYYTQLKSFEWGWTAIGLICLGITFCGLCPFSARWLINSNNLWANPNPPFLFISLMVFSCTLSHAQPIFVLTNRIMGFLARISYGLFLIHPSIFKIRVEVVFAEHFCRLFNAPVWTGFILRFFFFFGGSVLLATIFYYIIERPGINLGRILSRKLCQIRPTNAPTVC